MTVAIRDQNQPLRVGAVLGAAFHALGHHAIVMFVIAFIVIGPPDFLLADLINGYRQAAIDAGSTNRGITLLSFLITVALQSLASSALLLPVMRDREGGAAGLTESLGVLARQAPRLIGVAILYAIGLTISLVMLLVPFFFVATSWAAVPAVAAAETVGVNGAFRRGKALMQGSRTRILGIALVTFALLVMISFLTLMVGFLAVGEDAFTFTTRPGILAIDAIGSTIGGAVCGAVQCALYLELRDRKDGPSEQLDVIFS